MNIYGKIHEVVIALQSTTIKKSGRNPYAKFDYFELGDILPPLNILLKKHGLFCQFNFTQSTAKLTIRDTESDEFAEFECPAEKSTIKGADPVQNLGSMQTYLRRYLLLNAFSISESDVLDAIKGKDDKHQKKQSHKQQQQRQQPEQPKQPTQQYSDLQKFYNALATDQKEKFANIAKTSDKSKVNALIKSYAIDTTQPIKHDHLNQILAKIKVLGDN